MNELTPEPRPDINGKVTTRWVRTEAKKPNKTLASTHPSVAAQVVAPLTAEDAPIFSSFFTKNEINGVEGALLQITDINPEVARLIEGKLSAAEEGGFDYHTLSVDLTNAVDDAIRSTVSGKENADFTSIHNVAALRIGDRYRVQVVVNGLRTYPRFRETQDFILDVSPYESRVAQALCIAINKIDDNEVEKGGARGDYFVRLRNYDLAELVMKHPDRVEEITRIVNERDTTDVHLIKRVLDAPTRSLNEGIL